MKAKTKHIKPGASFSAGSSAVAVPIWERKYFFDILIFTFSFLLYTNSIPNEYNLDDELVTINHRLTSKGISAIPEIFVSPYYQDASGYSYEYRPMVLASFAIEYEIFGDNPHWSHFWNVILYSLTCVLLFRVLRALFQNYSPLIAIAITLLFVAHPAHTEVVCSIKNRDEILGLMFSLCAFLLAIRINQSKKIWMYILFPLFFVFSLLSKLTFISFAVIIPIALLYFRPFHLYRFLFIVLSLLIPVLYLANIGNLLSKVFVLLFVSASILIAFFLRKLFIGELQLKKLVNYTHQFQLKEDSQTFNTTSLRQFFSNLLPPLSNVNLYELVSFPLIVTIFVFATLNHVLLAQIVVLIVLVIQFFNKRDSAKFLAVTALISLALFRTCFLRLYETPYYLEFFSLPLAYFILFYKRSYLVTFLLAFVIVVFLFTIRTNSDMGFVYPFSLLLNLFLMQFRLGWVIIILAFLINLVTSFTEYSSSKLFFFYNLTNNIAIAVLAFAVFQKRYHIYIANTFLIICVAMSLMSKPVNQGDYAIAKIVVNGAKNINVTVLAKEENRPIDFAENCIDFIHTPKRVKAGTTLEILMHYIKKVVVPFPLSFYYGYSYISPMDITDAIPLLTIVVYLILIGIGALLFRKNKLISFGILTYLTSVAIFGNYFQPVPGMVADRFLLIPSIGWLVVLVAILFSVFKIDFNAGKFIPLPTGFVRYVFAFILITYSFLSFSRNFQWKDYLTLARHDVQYVSTSTQAHNLLGLRLMKSSYDSTNVATQLALRQEALGHFKKAVEIYPTFFNATFDIGRVYSILNVPDSALVYYEKAIKLNPSFVDAFSAAGDIYLQKGQLDSARIRYEKIIDAFPTQYVGYDKVSYMYFLQKEFDKSIALNKVAIEKIPSNPQAYISIAKAFYTQNKKDSSAFYLKKALTVSPGNIEASGLLQSLNVR